MLKELLVILNYPLSQNCMSHNIFLRYKGLQRFVENTGCNYAYAAAKGEGGRKKRTHLRGFDIKYQGSFDFTLGSFSCPQLSIRIKQGWGEKFQQPCTSQREAGKSEGVQRVFPSPLQGKDIFSLALWEMRHQTLLLSSGLFPWNPSWSLHPRSTKEYKTGKTHDFLWHKSPPFDTSWLPKWMESRWFCNWSHGLHCELGMSEDTPYQMKRCCNVALSLQLRKPWRQRPVRLSCGEAGVWDSAPFRFGLLLHVNPEHSNEVTGLVLIWL